MATKQTTGIQSSYGRFPQGGPNKKGPDAWHYSNFLVTLNTNVSMPKEDPDKDDRVEKLYKAADSIFSDTDQVGHLVEFLTKIPYNAPEGQGRLVNKGAWDDAHVRSVNSRSKVEISKNRTGNRLHLHIAVTIKHKDYIRLIPEAVKSAVNRELERLGFPYPIAHVDISVGRMSNEQYLTTQ